MGRLLSAHTKPEMLIVRIIPATLLAITPILFGVAASRLDLAAIGLVALLGIAFGVALSGGPVNRVEIYDNGIVYRDLWRKRTWKWSDIVAISRFEQSASATHERGYLSVKHSSGDEIKLHRLSDWLDLRRQIMAHIAPVICHRAADAIERGEDVMVTRSLHINHHGLIYKGKFIAWHDIQHVRSTNMYLVIDSPQLDTLQRRVTLNMDTTPNGMFYAELIHHLWKDIPLFSPLAEPTYIVIDGIHFNSEGEMIGGGE